MKLKIFQIDSFTSTVFKGNPAGVCPLDKWLDESLMRNIATEMNLSETGFFVRTGEHYEIRWFTPAVEIDLCGHATLAAAWVLANELENNEKLIKFSSRSGELRVRRNGEKFTLDFPVDNLTDCEVPDALLKALKISEPVEVLGGADFLVVVKNEAEVRNLSPNFDLLLGLPRRGVIVTAPGDSVDFVSRWFGPNVGVPEDPVTGSAHTTLTPYWAKRLKKSSLSAQQISPRGGELHCELEGDRVFITGSAAKFLEGEINLP